MKMIKTVATLVLSAGLVVSCSSPAQAAGSVSHACGVRAEVTIHKKAPGGVYVSKLPCGQGTSNVYRATVWTRPYCVHIPNGRKICKKAGEFFYPYNRGGSSTAVIHPVMSF